MDVTEKQYAAECQKLRRTKIRGVGGIKALIEKKFLFTCSGETFRGKIVSISLRPEWNLILFWVRARRKGDGEKPGSLAYDVAKKEWSIATTIKTPTYQDSGAYRGECRFFN